MKRTITLITLFSFLFTSTLSAQNSLQIIDPNWGWGSNGVQGTIEEAEFQIEPKGLYMEVGMFLTLSAQGTDYEFYDMLEIIFDFNLPSGSIVHDSWLWMNDTLIVQADILDISEATATYENIVDRNLDPSLLYRKANGSYQLRIFPLFEGGSRKVKITYLVPTTWNNDKVEAWLPIEFLSNSTIPLTTFNIISLADEAWGVPAISGSDDIEFQSLTDPVMGDLWFAEAGVSNFNKPIKFTFDSPLNAAGTYVNKFEDANNENFYQVAYLPPLMPVSVNPKNVVVVFDHDPENSNIEKSDLFDFVKEDLMASLKPEDQLNLFYSNSLGVQMASDTWIPCNPTALEQLFSNLTDPIGESSHFVEVLTEAIEFSLQNVEPVEIILIANSSEYFNYNIQLQTWLDMIGDAEIRVHIVNYQTLNYYWDYIWNAPDELAFAHKQIYENLTTSTGSNLFSSLESGVNTWEAITTAIRSLNNATYSFDLDIDVSSGFSYNSFYQTYQGQSVNLNQPILQVGKYLGDFPMTLEFSAYHDGVFIFDSITIESTEVEEMDTLGREIWTGHLIRSLEGSASNDVDVQNIVDISLSERVLSKYTAFLALELAQGGEPCIGCWHYEEIIIPAVEVTENKLGIEVGISPNPFSDYCLLSFELLGEERPEDINIQVFDAFGNLVTQLNAEELILAGRTQISWDGKDLNGRKLPAGVYHLVVQSKQEVASFKIVKIK